VEKSAKGGPAHGLGSSYPREGRLEKLRGSLT